MPQRLQNTTKWLWYILVLHLAPFWRPVSSVTARAPPSDPSTIEAQAKFFQDFFSVQLSPYKIEFGHVCEDPNTWEQRYEKKDFKNHRDMGKVRWGDKKGGYGEHYWDLNHAGYTDNHGNDGHEDDGSYHEDPHDTYDEPSEESPNYHTDYSPDEENNEENNRAKRAHNRHSVQTQRKERIYEEEPVQTRQKERIYEEEPVQTRQKLRKTKKQHKKDDKRLEEEDRKERQKPLNRETHDNEEEMSKPKERNNIVLVIDHHDREDAENPTTKPPETKHFVPYEGGAGVRQHHHAEATASASDSVPRLFLEPSTGHIVDRTTGQAYVLQPVIQNLKYD